MNIRNGCLEDAAAVVGLLEQLGYLETAGSIETRLHQLISHPDTLFIVAVDDADRVVGFVSARFGGRLLSN